MLGKEGPSFRLGLFRVKKYQAQHALRHKERPNATKTWKVFGSDVCFFSPPSLGVRQPTGDLWHADDRHKGDVHRLGGTRSYFGRPRGDQLHCSQHHLRRPDFAGHGAAGGACTGLRCRMWRAALLWHLKSANPPFTTLGPQNPGSFHVYPAP